MSTTHCFSIALVLSVASLALAKEEALQPFPSKPPSAEEMLQAFQKRGLISKKQEQHRQKGIPIRVVDPRQNMGFAIFRVKASPHRVWKVIADLEHYPKMVPEIKEAKVYQLNQKKDNRQQIAIHFKVEKRILLSFTRETHVIHDFPSDGQGFGTWHSDPKKPNDFEQTGFWHILPVAGKEDESEAVYCIRLIPKRPEDKLVKRWLISNGLDSVQQFVQANAEKVDITKSPSVGVIF